MVLSESRDSPLVKMCLEDFNSSANRLKYNLYLLCVCVCVCRTPLGRARAWLRLALMQKRLADYLRLLITRKDLLRCACLRVFTHTRLLV